MQMMEMNAYTSPSPEGLFYGKKMPIVGTGRSHEYKPDIFVIIFLIFTISYKAAQLRGLFRFVGCSYLL